MAILNVWRARRLYSIIILLIGRDVLFVDIDLLSLVGDLVRLVRPCPKIEEATAIAAKRAMGIFLGINRGFSALGAADLQFFHRA